MLGPIGPRGVPNKPKHIVFKPLSDNEGRVAALRSRKGAKAPLNGLTYLKWALYTHADKQLFVFFTVQK